MAGRAHAAPGFALAALALPLALLLVAPGAAAQERAPGNGGGPQCPNYREVMAGFAYPREAQEAGVEGQVAIDVVLEADGKVRSAAIAWTTSMEFDDIPLRRIVRKLRCDPPGRVTRLRLPLEFHFDADTAPGRPRSQVTRNPPPANAAEELEAMLAYTGREIMREPDHAEPYARRAALLQQKGDYAAAIADATRALQIEPDHDAALGLRATLRRMTGDLKGALVDVDRTIALHPTRAAAHWSRGYTLYSLADFAGAAASLAHGIDLAAAGERTDFPHLVRYIARRRGGEKGPAAAATLAAAVPRMEAWPAELAAMLLARRSIDATLQRAVVQGETAARKGRLCEAHFYAGARKAIEGDRTSAAWHWQAALAQDAFNYIETGFAQAELKGQGASTKK